MPTFRINTAFISAWLVCLALPVYAEAPAIDIPTIQTPAAEPPATTPETSAPLTSSDGRDASFLPPASMPDAAASTTSAPEQSSEAKPVIIQPSAPVPAISTKSPVEVVPPVTLPAAATGMTTGKAIELGKPVESGALPGINPDTIGLLATENGGLGAAMWKDTPRELIDRLLPSLELPTNSPALNDLARRFLLTTATVPEGKNEDKKTLASLRIEKLLALGDAANAWQLTQQANAGQVGDDTLRFVTEAILLKQPQNKDICAKVMGIIRDHGNAEWQKSLIVCQLRVGDKDAAQLGLEVLRAQDVKDDAFFDLAERNVIGGARALPRQLKPLKPLNVALLKLTDLNLPPELYAHPDAIVIPELLATKARDDVMRLKLAEQAAVQGLITSTQLADAYKASAFMAEQLNNPSGSSETGPRQRALLYQAIAAEKDPAKRLENAKNFLNSLDDAPLTSAQAQLLASLISDISSGNDNTAYSPMAAHLLLAASKPKDALAWLKNARQSNDPSIPIQLQSFWPLVALGGLESDSDYAKALETWFNAAVKDAGKNQREQIGNILLVLETAGFAVPETIWAKIVDATAASKRTLPPSTMLLERLRYAGKVNRRGEAVLLALAAANSTGNDPSPMTSIETIRALRLVGLPADALALAHEAVSAFLASAQAAKP